MKQFFLLLCITHIFYSMEYKTLSLNKKDEERSLINNHFMYQKTLKGCTNGIENVVFDPNNSNKLFSLAAGAVKIWNINKSLCEKTYQTNFSIESLGISSDGKKCVLGSDFKVLYWDTESDEKKIVNFDKKNYPNCRCDSHLPRIFFVPDNDDVIVTTFRGNSKFERSVFNAVTILNIKKGEQAVIEDPFCYVKDMAVDPHGKKTVGIASEDNVYGKEMLNFFDLETMQKKGTIQYSVRRFEYNPKKPNIFVTCAWQSPDIYFWDTRTHKPTNFINTTSYKFLENIGQDVTFLPDGKSVAVSSENRTQIYDVSSGKCIQKLNNVYSFLHALNCKRKDTGQHTDNIRGAKTSENKLVTYSSDNTIKVWERDNNMEYGN